MEKITVTVLKSTPDENGAFFVTLKAWHQGEEFQQPLDKPYNNTTWTDEEFLVYKRDFVRNINSQFE